MGAGTDYDAAPENGGQPIEANRVVELNNGAVWQSSTDHNGKFTVGNFMVVDQKSGLCTINNINGLAFPSSDGNLNQVLSTDGSGNLSWQSISALGGSGINNVNEDTSPELGGNLDVETYSIVSNTNRDINITPDGTGSVVLDGLSYPQADGTAGQAITTDGSGNLTFSDVSVDAAFVETPQTLTNNKTIAANTNAACVGPIALDPGVTITVGANSKLVVLN